MYEDRYEMTQMERDDIAKYQERLAAYGKLIRYSPSTGQPILDANDQPVEAHYERIAGSPTLRPRYIIDSKGVVWKFKARGSSRCPHLPDGGGSRCKSDYVEMWTGRWHQRRNEATGKMDYAKTTIEINMDGQVQGHPYTAKIEWMRQAKGYRHPYDEPQSPPQSLVMSMESRTRTLAPQIFAQTQQELAKSGIDKADEYIAAAAEKLAEKTVHTEPLPVPVNTLRTEPEKPTIAAHPKVRDYAKLYGIDLAKVVGTGKGGRVLMADIRAATPVPVPGEPEAPAGRSNTR